ncbi:hypothetical protein [Halomarina oriensis]|uniref:Uncharacterized protein n=1 Tax=Halomarina oriensis TaxID=671145 RepID=A0A6B0GM14_9EURY|nr:hypothetical protein [Halomarina oriensis]MWG35892.1 hypothetical protein [Halomarina oriensis]
MKGNPWIIGVVAILLVVGAPALNLGTANAAETTTATQTLTVDAGDSETLSPSPSAYAFENNETVTVNGTTYQEGTDYRFDAQNGTVTWLSSSQTQADAGADAQVAFAYQFHDENTTSIVGLVGNLGGFVAVLLLLVCVGFVALLAYGGGGGW